MVQLRPGYSLEHARQNHSFGKEWRGNQRRDHRAGTRNPQLAIRRSFLHRHTSRWSFAIRPSSIQSLSAAKQQAIQALRMEPATKLIYRFDQQLWDDDLLFFCHGGLVARWWIPGYGRGGSTVGNRLWPLCLSLPNGRRLMR